MARSVQELRKEAAEVGQLVNQRKDPPTGDNVLPFRGDYKLVPVETDRPPGERLKSLFFHSDVGPIEMLSAVIALAWGGWMLNPYSDLFTTTPQLYASAAAVAPEWVWGLIITGLGALQMYGILRGSPELRKQIAYTSAVFWLMVTVVAVNTALYTTAPVAYTTLTGMTMWVYLRITADTQVS